MTRQHVYIVPGFFGFTSLGSLTYFQGVTELLERGLARRGVDAVLHETDTLPTGSIRQRAIRLLRAIERTGGLDGGAIHLIGHSTGGLDARLLITPGVTLVPTDVEERIGRACLSLQTLSTPHFGTPLAYFFTTLKGRNLLYALTLLATSGPGRFGLAALAQALAMVARIDNFLGQTDTLLDVLAARLLRSVSADRSNRLWEFLHEISQDQGALIQLTPESIDLFNAAVTDRPGVRMVGHVNASPPPSSGTGLAPSLYAPIASALYALTYRLTAREHRAYRYPAENGDARTILRARLPFPVDACTNDGVVPSLSQVWGEIGHVVEGDHLDVVGQYARTWQGKAQPGWLRSGAGFGDRDMEALWDRVAQVIAETAR